MKAVTIRFADLSDFSTVADFINLLAHEQFDETQQRKLYLENIANPNIIYLLAFAEEKPVGFLSCHIQNLLHHGGKIGEIQEMYVDETARSSGVGKQLTDYLKIIARERNVLQLEVTSSLKRAAAHRFYERESFTFTHKKFTFKIES